VRVVYAGGTGAGPATMIAKMPTLDPGGRQVCGLFRFYEREIQFYDQLAVSMPIRTPTAYYTAMDIAADDYLLLLEDIDDLRVGDEVAGCRIAEAEVAIRAIATVQAGWWDEPKLEALEWMPAINAPVHQSAQGAYQQALPAFLQMFGDRLSSRMRETSERMATRIITMQHHFAQAPRTITHSDFRLDNMFFGDDSQMALIDWQITWRGRGIFDVAYFLSTALPREQRRAEEMRLLRVWYDIVTAGRTGYSWEDAVTDYRRAILFCNLYTVIGIGTLDPSNERGMALMRAWVERRCGAIEDLDAAEMMPA
jgi:hypothetical protein